MPVITGKQMQVQWQARDASEYVVLPAMSKWVLRTQVAASSYASSKTLGWEKSVTRFLSGKVELHALEKEQGGITKVIDAGDMGTLRLYVDPLRYWEVEVLAEGFADELEAHEVKPGTAIFTFQIQSSPIKPI